MVLLADSEPKKAKIEPKKENPSQFQVNIGHLYGSNHSCLF